MRKNNRTEKGLAKWIIGRRRGEKENHRLITVLTCRSVIVFARARVIHRTNLLTFIFLRQVIEILHEICDESNLNYFEKVNLCVLVCYKQKNCEYRFSTLRIEVQQKQFPEY